jgi:hypothetical protein
MNTRANLPLCEALAIRRSWSVLKERKHYYAEKSDGLVSAAKLIAVPVWEHNMGFFSNRKEKKQEEQRAAAELEQRRDRLAAKFEQGIASLASAFEEAMQGGFVKNTENSALRILQVIHSFSKSKYPTIEQMLVGDFVHIVCTIGEAVGNPSLSVFKSGGGVCWVAFIILKKVAPEMLPRQGDFLPELATMNFTDELTRSGAEFSEFIMACKTLRDGCKFCTPGMLLVMEEYDKACGTLHSYTVADLFLAFMLELEMPPVALNGTTILEAYTRALREYLAAKPTDALVQAP